MLDSVGGAHTGVVDTHHEDVLTLLNCIKPAWSTICRWVKEKSVTKDQSSATLHGVSKILRYMETYMECKYKYGTKH